MQTITAYKTDDGSIFESAQECKAYENKNTAVDAIHDLLSRADLGDTSGRWIGSTTDFINQALDTNFGKALFDVLETVHGKVTDY